MLLQIESNSWSKVPPTQATELAPCSRELTLFPHPTLTAHLCNVVHSARVEAGPLALTWQNIFGILYIGSPTQIGKVKSMIGPQSQGLAQTATMGIYFTKESTTDDWGPKPFKAIKGDLFESQTEIN
jgi:hypothetical protein